MRRAAVIFLAIFLMILASPSIAAAETTITHSPTTDQELESGDSYEFDVDTNGESITDINIDAFIEYGEGWISASLKINGESKGNVINTASYNHNEVYTFDFSLSEPVVTDDTATIEVEFSSAELTIRSTDEAEITTEDLSAELSSPEETNIDSSPTELSVSVDDVDGFSNLVFTNAETGDIIDTKHAEAGEMTTSWDWDSESTSDGSLQWEATLGDAIVSSSFSPDVSAPEVSDATPTDLGKVTDAPDELSVSVSDDDFETPQGDEVFIEFFFNGESVGTESTTTAGDVSTSFEPVAGENDWYAVAEDAYGNTAETETFTFTMPYELEIRDETNPENLLDSDEIELRVRFFGDDEQVFERTATDGTVDLGGLPADEELVVTVRDENADYVWRRILIDSIFEQSKIYLLPATEPSSEIRFQLRDDTSRFPPDEARLFVEKPLTVDGETTYQTIAGDEFSAGGEFPTTLVEEERYRLRVSNDAGEERLLGAYTVTGPDNPTVPIGTVQIAGDVETEPVAQASLRAAHPDADHEYEARVIYIDEEDATDAITVGVESEAGETVRPETEESGPYGRYIETYPINDHNFDPDEDSLVVHVEADRGDEGTETWDIPVGDLPDVLADADIDPWILELIGWVSLIALAGLIVIISPSLAAIVTVGYAALLTAIGILPIPGVAIGVAGSTAILYRLGGGGLR